MSRFDEEPDANPHKECADEIHSLLAILKQFTASAAQDREEIARLTRLLGWSYGKLHDRTFSKMEDTLKLDEIRLFLEHGV